MTTENTDLPQEGNGTPEDAMQESGSGQESGAGVETDAESETDAGQDSESETAPESETDSELETDAGQETDSEPESDTEERPAFQDGASTPGSSSAETSSSQMPNLMPSVSVSRSFGWVNLAIWVIVICVVALLFCLGPDLFRVKPSNHFLAGIPVGGLDALYSVSSKEADSSLSSDTLVDKTVLIILWGPWESASCDTLQKLGPAMTAATKNPHFQLMPIAYLDAWSGMSRQEFGMETPRVGFAPTDAGAVAITTDEELQKQQEADCKFQLSQMLHRQAKIQAQVQQVCSTNALPFTQNWWDPTDDFRTGLTAMALTIFPERKYIAAGVGLPTFLWVENGVVKSVWAGSASKNIEELNEQLKLTAAGQ